MSAKRKQLLQIEEEWIDDSINWASCHKDTSDLTLEDLWERVPDSIIEEVEHEAIESFLKNYLD